MKSYGKSRRGRRGRRCSSVERGGRQGEGATRIHVECSEEGTEILSKGSGGAVSILLALSKGKTNKVGDSILRVHGSSVERTSGEEGTQTASGAREKHQAGGEGVARVAFPKLKERVSR